MITFDTVLLRGFGLTKSYSQRNATRKLPELTTNVTVWVDPGLYFDKF